MNKTTSQEFLKTNNCLEWIFEKIFKQLVPNKQELYDLPFSEIYSRTFCNSQIHQLIAESLKSTPIEVETYLTDNKFIEKFLFVSIRREYKFRIKKLHVQIMLKEYEKIEFLINNGYKVDFDSLKLACLNGSLDILNLLLKFYQKKLSSELLMYCSEFSHYNIYQLLTTKYNLYPNLSVFYRAVLSDSIEIVEDVSSNISANQQVMENAFKTNHTNIINLLLVRAKKDGTHIDRNLVVYPIMNCNFELLAILSNMNLIDWHVELYYSALLSGSMEMIIYLEDKIGKINPDFHKKKILDSSHQSSGKNSLLLEDIIYEVDGKKYFSHTMNYAIQSGSVDVVDYIWSRGYGITVSNFITAIKQGSVEILERLCERYHLKLPIYLIHYFSTKSYVTNKIAKAKVLIENKLLMINEPVQECIELYKKEETHIKLIEQPTQIVPDSKYDPDYLMQYSMFFIPMKGFKLNHRLITQIRINLQLNYMDNLIELYTRDRNYADKMILLNNLFLFGTIDQIKILYPLLKTKYCPDKQILMEIICKCEITKLCYLKKNKLFDNDIVQSLIPLVIMLENPLINALFSKLTTINLIDKYIVLSNNVTLIRNWLNESPVIDKNQVKSLFLLNDLEITDNILSQYSVIICKHKEEFIDWCEEEDLLDTRQKIEKKYLK